jgi:hypothetical protein
LDAGGLIRRYYGKVVSSDESIEFEYGRPLPPMFGDVCIEINYEKSNDPAGWSMVNGQSKEGPLRFVAVASVQSEGKIHLDSADRSEQQLNKPDVWVVDKVEQQQYVNTEFGNKQSIPLTRSSPRLLENSTHSPINGSLSTESVARILVCLAGLTMTGIAMIRWKRWSLIDCRTRQREVR